MLTVFMWRVTMMLQMSLRTLGLDEEDEEAQHMATQSIQKRIAELVQEEMRCVRVRHALCMTAGREP